MLVIVCSHTRVGQCSTVARPYAASCSLHRKSSIAITEEQRTLITRLLLERIALRRICRAVGIGLRWLWQCMGAQFQAASEHLNVAPQRGTLVMILQRLEAELDEL